MEANSQKSNIEHLLTLIKENPDIEIKPMVDAEIVCSDDFAWWVGGWGSARVDEYWVSDERIYLKSEDFDTLVEDRADNLFAEPEYATLSDDEFQKKMEALVEGYDWEKAIFVMITLPYPPPAAGGAIRSQSARQGWYKQRGWKG